ncbi:universal stress protein [Actinoplanes sp. KI2]|uniref:universal stress protein n=1 Tax=Actinoplanes sp. KI2 TaxID=2983315 RepID=UPI0021D576A6|nr:universal stress protein [Actinoplanes sp. KI2]MCU7729445.1 universal stress protein [Actinoplanes sp. KI2]
MSTVTGAPVVVGVDGSARGLAAAAAAAEEAALRHRPLVVVHALVWIPAGAATDPVMAPPAHETYEEQGQAYVDKAVALAARSAPGIRITGRVVPGAPSAVLVDESRRADLLVVGDSGVGVVAGMVAGSVAMHAAKHGSCPVLVVRGANRAGAPVVVGVDGSAASAETVVFAAEEAAGRDAQLVALHACSGDGAGRAEQVLAESLGGLAEKYPGLQVGWQVRKGSARRLLTGWSRLAQLVVVGNHGGGFAGMPLGSVGRHLVDHAGCPVAVVRRRA